MLESGPVFVLELCLNLELALGGWNGGPIAVLRSLLANFVHELPQRDAWVFD